MWKEEEDKKSLNNSKNTKNSSNPLHQKAYAQQTPQPRAVTKTETQDQWTIKALCQWLVLSLRILNDYFNLYNIYLFSWLERKMICSDSSGNSHHFYIFFLINLIKILISLKNELSLKIFIENLYKNTKSTYLWTESIKIYRCL